MFEKNLQQHLETFQNLKYIQPEIELAGKLVRESCIAGNTIFSCGNGGSAADSQHFAAELTGRYMMDRRSYAGISLTVDTSALTAIANDYGYNRVFSRQLEGLGRRDDVLLGISTSGNSDSVVEALKVAKQKGMKTIMLLGRDGGKLNGAADISIIVPSDTTARIQEAHIFILHQICEQLEF